MQQLEVREKGLALAAGPGYTQASPGHGERLLNGNVQRAKVGAG